MASGHEAPQTRALHYIEGAWREGNPPIMGPMTHATWMSSIVFDGARAFEGVTPDLDRHCQRLIASARTMGLAPPLSAGEVEEIAHDGIGRFANGTALYIRPMLWAESGFIVPDPQSTRFCLTLFEAPMPEPKGFGVCLSPYRRPTPETAPTLAKAACLYPNSVRAIQDANQRGFDNAVILDSLGNVAELATANIWLAKDGAAHTACRSTSAPSPTRTSPRPTRSSPPATSARCCRSPASTIAICSRARSMPAPAGSIGSGRTAAELAPLRFATTGDAP